MNLVLPTLRLGFRRVFGGMATKGQRASRAAVLGVLVGAAEAFAISEAQRQTTAHGPLSALIPPVVAIALYLAGGSIVLMAVATRDSSGSTRRALMMLPLSRIGIVFHEWISVFSTALVLVGLTAAPALTALLTAGYPAGPAVSLVATALGTGAGSSGLLLAGVSTLLRDGEWNATRYPLTMLVWTATAATAVWRSFAQDAMAGPAVGDMLLLLPPLIREAGLGAAVDPWIGTAAGVGALLVVGVIVPLALSGRLSERRRLIRWRWTGGEQSTLLSGELVYSTRNATLAANAVAAEVLVLGLCLLLGLMPMPLRAPLLAPAMTIAACFVGSVVRQHRSRFPALRPPQQIINLKNAPWVVRQFAISLCWFALLYAPPAVTALWLGLSPDAVWSVWVPAGAMSFAVSALAGWLLPFPLDNAPGQLLVSMGAVSAAGALAAFIVDLTANVPWLALAVCGPAISIALAVAIAAEHRRWTAR